MAKIVLTLATHPGAGKTTVHVNLAAGLVQKGYSVLVLIMGNNNLIAKWLQVNTETESVQFPQGTRAGINLITTGHSGLSPARAELDSFIKDYDYILIDVNRDDWEYIVPTVRLADYIIACTDLYSDDEPKLLANLNGELQIMTGRSAGINLVVPCKINPKEWENNTTKLFNLAEYLGYEKIADPIPHCEAIHDLPLLGQTVWELPDKYQNRKDAFKRLLERVEDDLSK